MLDLLIPILLVGNIVLLEAIREAKDVYLIVGIRVRGTKVVDLVLAILELGAI
jgi:hypothetical protein